jgi:hypothetical protein
VVIYFGFSSEMNEEQQAFL